MTERIAYRVDSETGQWRWYIKTPNKSHTKEYKRKYFYKNHEKVLAQARAREAKLREQPGYSAAKSSKYRAGLPDGYMRCSGRLPAIPVLIDTYRKLYLLRKEIRNAKL